MSHAICLGEILIDCFAQQPGISRVEVSGWTPLPGGGSANVACGLAKLGRSVEFVGAVGKDHWGEALVTLLDDMHVGRRGVQYRLKAPTREVYITPDIASEAQSEMSTQLPTQLSAQQTIHYAFAGFSESDPTVFADAHLFAGALATDLFDEASALVLGTLSLAYSDTRECVEKAVELAVENDLWIIVDINWRPMFWPRPAEAPGRIYDLLRRTHFLKVSMDEADWLFGTVSAKAIAHQFPHMKGVLVTDAEQGCEYCFRQGNRQLSGKVPCFVVDVEDVTGAGDAFTAGFVHQLLHQGSDGFGLEDEATAHRAVAYASAMSALTTTRLGAIAALPTPNEIEVFLYLN